MEIKTFTKHGRYATALVPRRGDTLVIDCGIDPDVFLKATEFKPYSICGVLVSSPAIQASRFAPKAISKFLHIYAPKSVIDACQWDGRAFQSAMKPFETVEIGAFKVRAMPVSGNGYGFIITHPECGRIAYVTDCACIQPYFTDIDTWIVETHFSNSAVAARMAYGHRQNQAEEEEMHRHLELRAAIDGMKTCGAAKHAKNIIFHNVSENIIESTAFALMEEAFPSASLNLGKAGSVIDVWRHVSTQEEKDSDLSWSAGRAKSMKITARCVELAERGETAADIARIMGISLISVHQRLRNNNAKAKEARK